MTGIGPVLVVFCPTSLGASLRSLMRLYFNNLNWEDREAKFYANGAFHLVLLHIFSQPIMQIEAGLCECMIG
jgi:hypothetical protein